MAVALVGDVFDAADVDAAVVHEEFYVCYCVRWRRVGFYGDAGLGGVDGAGTAG